MTRQQAFEQLYRRHHGEIFRAALRATGDRTEAEDVTQGAFADAYRAWTRGAAPREPRAWLFAIAANVRKRRWLARSRRPAEVELGEADAVAADADVASTREVRAALEDLPERQRRVVLLREVGGFSYEEIADATGMSVGSIQMLLHRARRTLRERLGPSRVPALLGWLGQLVGRFGETGPALRAAGALGAVVVGGGAVYATSSAGGAAPSARPSRPPVLHDAASPAPLREAVPHERPTRVVVPARRTTPPVIVPARAAPLPAARDADVPEEGGASPEPPAPAAAAPGAAGPPAVVPAAVEPRAPASDSATRVTPMEAKLPGVGEVSTPTLTVAVPTLPEEVSLPPAVSLPPVDLPSLPLGELPNVPVVETPPLPSALPLPGAGDPPPVPPVLP